MTTDHVGTKTMKSDTPFERPRYKITCLCHRCGKEFSYTTTRITDRDRPCPRKACKEAAMQEEIALKAENLARMLAAGTPPGHIGDKVIVKAVDATAQIVMEDHHMTNLQDNVRAGEAVAPKLPVEQQKMADGFFGGRAMQERMGLGSRQMNLLGRRAMAGAFRNAAVNPGIVMPGHRGDPVLRPVRTETLK